MSTKHPWRHRKTTNFILELMREQIRGGRVCYATPRQHGRTALMNELLAIKQEKTMSLEGKSTTWTFDCPCKWSIDGPSLNLAKAEWLEHQVDCLEWRGKQTVMRCEELRKEAAALREKGPENPDLDWNYVCGCGYEVCGPERDLALADHYDHYAHCLHESNLNLTQARRKTLARSAQRIYQCHEEIPCTRRGPNDWGLPEEGLDMGKPMSEVLGEPAPDAIRLQPGDDWRNDAFSIHNHGDRDVHFYSADIAVKDDVPEDGLVVSVKRPYSVLGPINVKAPCCGDDFARSADDPEVCANCQHTEDAHFDVAPGPVHHFSEVGKLPPGYWGDRNPEEAIRLETTPNPDSAEAKKIWESLPHDPDATVCGCDNCIPF